MEPLTRTTVYPNRYELDAILQRYPGWLTELSEGTIPNPELPATQEELLVHLLSTAAEEIGVYKQKGIPARRYLSWWIANPSESFIDTIRTVVDKRDDTSFALMNHLLEGPMDNSSIEEEVESALRYHEEFSISYYDAAFLIRLIPVYQEVTVRMGLTALGSDPSAIKIHLAMARITKTINDVYPVALDTVLTTTKGIRHSHASFSRLKQNVWQINNPDLFSIAIDYADEIESVCQLIVDRGFTDPKELRELVQPMVESLRNGGSTTLIPGTL